MPASGKISLALILLAAAPHAVAQEPAFCPDHPGIPQLLQGTAECIYDSATGSTQIDLSSSALIQWQRFGVPEGSRMSFRFIPGAEGIVVNRNLTGSAIIDGALEASGGSLVLQNPTGSIQIGASGSITAPSIVLTTHSKIPEQSLFGTYSGATHPIFNRGTIRATAGDAIILGSGVTNEALIEAPNGSALIASGETATIESGANSLFVTSQGNRSINQRGIIRAQNIAYAAEGDILIARGSRTEAPTGQIFFRVSQGGRIIDEDGAISGTQVINGIPIADAPEFQPNNGIPTSRTPSIARFPALTPNGRPVVRFTNSAIAGLVDSGKRAKGKPQKKRTPKVLLAGTPTTRATTAGTWLRKSSFFGARGSKPAAPPKKK